MRRLLWASLPRMLGFTRNPSRRLVLEKADTSFNTGNAEGFRASPNNHPAKPGDFAWLRASWLTEILVGLGYEVYALEPSEEMIVAAQQRIAGFIHHHRDRNPPPVHHLCEALEECSLPD